MQLAGITMRLSVAVGLAATFAGSAVEAQQRDSSTVMLVTATPIPAAAMESFAAANIAIADFRGKVQAELAEPRSKKPETQELLREKLQAGTERLLKEHNLTDAEFTRLTKRVSTDEGARKQFDEAMARLAKR